MLAIIFIAGLAAGSLRSQEAAPGSTLTVNARLVVLDVVVTDKSGKPVTDLTAKDFQVYEDGKLQRIRSVEPPSEHGLPPESVAGGAGQSFEPAQPASFGRSPVTVLVLDQLNTHFADSSFARRSVQEYLTKQPELLTQPTTLLTVYDGHFKVLEGFTRDRGALVKALDAAPTEYAWRLEVNGKAAIGPVERLDQSLRALEQIAESYAGIRGRKNLVWVGTGFPSMDPTAISNADAQEVKDTLQHITDILLETRVTIYAVDPTSSAAGMTEVIDPTQMAFVLAAGDALSGSIDPFGASDDFDRLGPVTGGRVVRGRNDVAAQIASAVELGGSSYAVAYTPESESAKAAQYRAIKVMCLRPGVTVLTRSGYYSGPTEQAKSTATASYDLTTAAESPIPLNGLHVSVAEEAGAPGSWIVKVGAAELMWKGKADGGSSASVYIMAVSLNDKNKMVAHTLRGMIANAKAGTDLHDPSRAADFSFGVPVDGKAKKLRFVVRDSATGKMGSYDLPVKKP